VLWIADHAEELHEHTVPKCFKFELNEEGKAIMHYKNWSHEQWQGPIVMLKIYTGRYRNPRERQAPIAMVDDFLTTLEVG
ncbi:hypothetical protein P5673_030238, partial [Acropora cervicornis]